MAQPTKSVGVKTPPTAPEPTRCRGGDELREQHRQQHDPDELAIQDGADDAVTIPPDLLAQRSTPRRRSGRRAPDDPAIAAGSAQTATSKNRAAREMAAPDGQAACRGSHRSPAPSSTRSEHAALPRQGRSRGTDVLSRLPSPRRPRAGPKLSIAVEPGTISETSSAPEIGALYAAAIPAAPPRPAIGRRRGMAARQLGELGTRHRRELHHRTFAAGQACRGDGEQRGKAVRDRRPKARCDRAGEHRFHVVDRAPVKWKRGRPDATRARPAPPAPTGTSARCHHTRLDAALTGALRPGR